MRSPTASAEAFDLFLLGELADNGVGRLGVELGRGSVAKPEHVVGKLDDGDLEAQADAQIGNCILPAMPDARDLPLNAAGTKPSGNNDGIEAGELLAYVARVDLGRVDPLDINVGHQVSGAVLDGLVDGGVGIAEVSVLAREAQRDGAGLGCRELSNKMFQRSRWRSSME